MRGHLTKTIGMLALTAFCSHPSQAQERTNPFVRPPTAAEEQARQDERTRNIIREMQPEIKAGIMQDVKAADASLEINLRKRIDTLAEARPATPQATISGDAPIADKKPDEKTAPVKIPEGSEFISCVNGKALYRDKDKTLFQVQGNGVTGSDRCAG
jgi:deferrochelatase/peroxidase EfeB